MKMSEDDEIQFWWSYIVPYFSTTRGFFDYWGHDLGDLRFLWKNLTPGMVFLDIGAYHGIYSIVAAKKLGANGTVVAFEPSPDEYRRLRLHMRLNGLSFVRTEPLALGSASSTRTFFRVTSGDTTRGGASTPGQHRSSFENIRRNCPCRRLRLTVSTDTCGSREVRCGGRRA